MREQLGHRPSSRLPLQKIFRSDPPTPRLDWFQMANVSANPEMPMPTDLDTATDVPDPTYVHF